MWRLLHQSHSWLQLAMPNASNNDMSDWCFIKFRLSAVVRSNIVAFLFLFLRVRSFGVRAVEIFCAHEYSFALNSFTNISYLMLFNAVRMVKWATNINGILAKWPQHTPSLTHNRGFYGDVVMPSSLSVLGFIRIFVNQFNVEWWQYSLSNSKKLLSRLFFRCCWSVNKRHVRLSSIKTSEMTLHNVRLWPNL